MANVVHEVLLHGVASYEPADTLHERDQSSFGELIVVQVNLPQDVQEQGRLLDCESRVLGEDYEEVEIKDVVTVSAAFTHLDLLYERLHQDAYWDAVDMLESGGEI